MELKTNMYVRTKYGIAQFIKLSKDKQWYILDKKIVYDNIENWENIVSKKEILKASYDIIYLIEVGDYVNGYKVSAIYNPNGDEIFWFILITRKGYKQINPHIDNFKIKSIVTKEQFESISYKVD